MGAGPMLKVFPEPEPVVSRCQTLAPMPKAFVVSFAGQSAPHNFVRSHMLITVVLRTDG